MSYTGRYKYNKETGELEKISGDSVPHVGGVFDCYCPEGGYYSEHLGQYVRSRTHKREILRSRGLAENTCGKLESIKREL
jgi:hypothetical protein